MAKPNYAFEKRQREITKKQKKEKKLQRKTELHQQPTQEDTPHPTTDERTD
jgi:hypothetical protein